MRTATRMKAKFAGTCDVCHEKIRVNSPIIFKGYVAKPVHEECYAIS